MFNDSIIQFTTRSVRRAICGNSQKFEFTRCNNLKFPDLRETGIYVHVPFCEQLCPYCPYYRTSYNELFAKQYIQAIIKEISFYAKRFSNLSVKSVYFGGGTPTVLSEELLGIISAIKNNFKVEGPICLETNPSDLTQRKIDIMKLGGVNSVSLGVQSFSPKLLELIGRKYNATKILKVLAWLKKSEFLTINVDLMFALPGQTPEDFISDLEIVTSESVDQITCYPLFTFPYSSIGKYKRLKSVKMPNLSLRKKMYYSMYDYLTKRGYKRASVWSFKKNLDNHRYSSVTRERYVGFGPGAGSYYGSKFTLNTFSVEEYISSVNRLGHSVALEMPFNKSLSIGYDFYWRLYDTYIPKTREIDNSSYRLKDLTLYWLFIRFCKKCGFIDEENDFFNLTKKGTFWIHLIQNYFSLRYINTIWSAAKKEPWPKYIKF